MFHSPCVFNDDVEIHQTGRILPDRSTTMTLKLAQCAPPHPHNQWEPHKCPSNRQPVRFRADRSCQSAVKPVLHIGWSLRFFHRKPCSYSLH